MPLFREILTADFQIAIWKIEEPESFFENSFPRPDFTLEPRRLQWYATRHLIRKYLGADAEIIKKESGQPVLKDSSVSISITHSSGYAAIMWSETMNVGLDLETISLKILRIAPKFLEDWEIEATMESERVKHLIVYWSAKETLYKLYGAGGLEFRTQILIKPFHLEENGKLSAEIKAGSSFQNLCVQYEFFDNQVITSVAHNRIPT